MNKIDKTKEIVRLKQQIIDLKVANKDKYEHIKAMEKEIIKYNYFRKDYKLLYEENKKLKEDKKVLIKNADCCMWKDCINITKENEKFKNTIKQAIDLLSIDGKGTKKQVLNLLKEVIG